MTNPWDLIFNEEFELAYKLADENYLKTSEYFDLRARAICSLLLQKYENALADFLTINKNEKNTNRVSDGTYMEIALCYYAMGDFEKAVEYFEFPITNRKEIKYTIDISIPASVLFYIAIKLKRPEMLTIAKKELKRLKQIIPLFLLGQLSELELNKMYEQQNHQVLINRKQCKVAFYKAVKAFENGHFQKYKEHLENCVNLKGSYLEFEYFLAKVEHFKSNSL